MRIIKINNQDHQVDKLLSEYKIEGRNSSSVDFIGDNGSDVFIQFKNGKSYLYKNVSKEHINQMYAAESIGRFISVLSKGYHYVPLAGQLVKACPLVVMASHDSEVKATIVSPAE